MQETSAMIPDAGPRSETAAPDGEAAGRGAQTGKVASICKCQRSRMHVEVWRAQSLISALDDRCWRYRELARHGWQNRDGIEASE